MPQTISQQIASLKEEIHQVEAAIAHNEVPQALTPDPRKYPAIAQLEAMMNSTRDIEQREQAIEFLKMDTDAKRDRLAQLEAKQSEAFKRLQNAGGKLQDMAAQINQAHEKYLKTIAQFIEFSDSLNSDRQLLQGTSIYALGALIPIQLHSMLAPFKAQVNGSSVALYAGKADFLAQRDDYGAIGINPKYLPTSVKEKHL
jgi:hypothetical protein